VSDAGAEMKYNDYDGDMKNSDEDRWIVLCPRRHLALRFLHCAVQIFQPQSILPMEGLSPFQDRGVIGPSSRGIDP